ncbi:MAG: AMP-binding protein [Burkholderiaceae bacterium]|jgi:fatty-acyl-CoA synthase
MSKDRLNATADVDAQLAPRHHESHVQGVTGDPLSEATVSAFLASIVARYPHEEAVVFREHGVRWTWRQFAAEVDGLARGLAALGLKKGDRLGIWSPNRPEWVVTQFATARLGIILVNINPAYQLTELEYALNKVSCRAIISAERFKTSNYLGMLEQLAPELASAVPGSLQAARLPHLEIVIRLGEAASPGMLNYRSVIERGVDGPALAELDTISAGLHCHEPINIQFTSGTTGHPKGATLTHHNVVNNARYIAFAMRMTQQDRLCIPVPLYHCFGMVIGVLVCVATGAKMVFPGEGFDPLATLEATAKERCTALHGVPTMFIAELGHAQFAQFDLSSLRTGVMAGSPCPIETMKRVVSQMHMQEVTICYGMTETSPVSFQSSTTDPLDKRVTTVGRVHPHLEVKIIDGNGATVPVGQSGELCTRGYSVMQGYWADPQRTAESVIDGWMHTGDLATLDEEGYCNIVGRVKDMVIRGGENVYPREIEEFLFTHPLVESVQVFGVPDSKYGEELAAWVILKPGCSTTEEEIREFCRGKIAHYKVPRYVRFVKELPMTVTGKAQKFVMRDAMIRDLGLHIEKTA